MISLQKQIQPKKPKRAPFYCTLIIVLIHSFALWIGVVE
jgi:hypothetical protein